MLVRFISAGIALATMAFGSAVCADELPAPRIRKTTRPVVKQGLRPAPRRAPAAPGDLQAIDLGTPKRVAPLAMEGPSNAYRALERRIYGRSRETRRANLETPKTVTSKTVTSKTAARRAPAVRPVDLRKTYAPGAAKAQTRITASQQQAGSTSIATRSRRGSMPTVQKSTVQKTRRGPTTIIPRTPATRPAPIVVSDPFRTPRPPDATGAGVIPPDPAAPAIPRGPGAVRRLDVPGCLDGT